MRIPMLKILMLCLTVVARTDGTHALELGDLSPDFKLQSNTGGSVTLSQFRGKVVVIDFWNSWCKTCHKSLNWIQSMQRKIPHSSFEVITINLDESPDDALQLLKKKNLNLLVAYDPHGSTPEAFQIESTPTSILIDRSGKIRVIHTGFDDESAADLEKKIMDAVENPERGI